MNVPKESVPGVLTDTESETPSRGGATTRLSRLRSTNGEGP